MFLTESYYNGYNGITADPICGMEIINEAENMWHDLEVGMIKLEHTAIVNEDASLLNEGVKEYFTKAKEFFIKTGNKFLEFIQKVIMKWQEIQMKIQSKLMNVDKLVDKIKFQGTVELGVSKKIIDIAQAVAKGEVIDKVLNLGTTIAKQFETSTGDIDSKAESLMETIKTEAEKISSDGLNLSDNDTTLDLSNKSEVKRILNFIKNDRPKAIKTLQNAKKQFAKMIKSAVAGAAKECPLIGKFGNQSISVVKKAINSLITIINRVSVIALKVINAAKSKKATKDSLEKKVGKEEWRTYRGSGITNKSYKNYNSKKSESYSILDSFM
jgi:hypothetical protein